MVNNVPLISVGMQSRGNMGKNVGGASHMLLLEQMTGMNMHRMHRMRGMHTLYAHVAVPSPSEHDKKQFCPETATPSRSEHMPCLMPPKRCNLT